MTTITASEYSPNHPAQSLDALKSGQVALLNQGKTYDISQQVRTVVQSHLGYKGPDVFKTTFTKQEITFTLNVDATQNRILRLENGLWKLSQNKVPDRDFDLNATNEVNTLVTKILANIGKASQEKDPNPAPVSGAAAVEGVDADLPAANASELADIRQRLTALEAQLQANPTLEQSLRVQQEILEQLAGLRAALERHPEAGTAERDALRGQVDQLRRALAEEGGRNERTLAQQKKEFEQAMKVSQGRFESLQADLAKARLELARQQQVHGEKGQAAAALQEKVVALAAELDLKTSEQKQLSKELDASKLQVDTVSRHKESLKDELAVAKRDLEKQQQALVEKGHATAALQDRVAELEATVSQKDAEQKRALEEFETFKTKADSVRDQLKAQCERDVQAADKKVIEMEQAVKNATDHSSRGVTALREQQAQKAFLEQQLAAVQLGFDLLKQTNQKDLAEASLQLEALRAEKTTLEARLGASTDEAKSANAELSQKIGDLEKQIQAQQAQLASGELLNKSQAALIAKQEQQLQELEKHLTSNEEEDRSLREALVEQNKQLKGTLAQLQQTLKDAQSKNSSELAAATEKLQGTAEANQLLEERVRDLTELREGAIRVLEDQRALMEREQEAQRSKDQVVLERMHQIKSAAAEKVRKLEADVAETQSMLRDEQQKNRQMEAQLKEALASQVEAVEALQAGKNALKTSFDAERQKLTQEQVKVSESLLQAEGRLKAQEAELLSIKTALEKMHQSTQEAVVSATHRNLAESQKTADVYREVADLLLVKPKARIAAVDSVEGTK